MSQVITEFISRRELFTQDNQYNQSYVLLFTVASSIIWIMVPGLAFLYSGLARRKSALSMIWICIMSSFIGVFQWYFWGYSLAFSSTSSNPFIGDLHFFGFQNLLGSTPSESDYPEIAFGLFQLQFLLVTLAILAGGCIAERGRFLPSMIFLFCWATVVYCPVVYWIWGGGWAMNYKSGVLDYAGGGPVEILSGVSAFVYSAFLGRRNETLMINYRPHNISTIFLGTSLLYVGWLFFNGFSCGNPSLKVAYSMMNTHICGAFGAISWCLLDFRLENKWSMVAVCSGCISGLVAATPSSGVIPLWASVILGITAGIVCNLSTKIKYLCRVDDSLDVLAEHGIAGVVGLLFNALFGSATVIGYDNVTDHEGGWLDHNWKQLYIQIAYILAVAAYSAVVTAILCFVIDKIPGLHLRIDYNAEEVGVDEDQIGEFAYDYVEVRRDFLDWGNPQVNPNLQAHSIHEGMIDNQLVRIISVNRPEVFNGDANSISSNQDSGSINEKRGHEPQAYLAEHKLQQQRSPQNQQLHPQTQQHIEQQGSDQAHEQV
ncbi:low affinity high capacity ammonium permease [Spathaspora passalidarum NRRL Y-27907]|uniref:Ammonium transporter n=1 Tax=Spathaspora passalidarum (strain NRRL Y-27907 / 11-Y1) TaxID=619300 RepID=G3AQC9_SPAPN|nr:low affinity high capacity ammonium permease [Spathaspora passalidarum NRRL Y-27907]EGW31476.1 low affinity high capacity ammonium permease [Spathaspora passalidarum NRRL Y-27907]